MSKMSAARHEKHLLLAAAVVLGFLLVAFVGDVDSSNVYKEKPVNEQSDKSQIPPLYKDPKTVCSNNYALLRSAWVIMAIILMVVLGVMALYYWLLFYPIVCKKERKYDVMQMSAKP